MSRKFSKQILCAALLLTTAAAHAQTQDTLRGNPLDEVIVTANKYPQKQSTTGKVVSVITKEQIEKSSGRTVGQLLNEQAGITINGALNTLGTNQTVYMRGAASGRTLILIDGVPVNDPSTVDNSFDLNFISLNNVERIEIARGAQSTLYGSDAMAGVINIITNNKDAAKPLNVKATVAAGNYSTYRGNVQLYGKAQRLSYNAGYAKLYSKGFSTAYDSTGNGNFDKDGYNGDAANASLQYQFTRELAVRAFGKYSRYKTDLDYSRFVDDKDFTNTNRILMAGGNVFYNRNNVRITGTYQYSENTRRYLNDSLDISYLYDPFSTDNYFTKSQFAELYSNIELSRNVSLLQGADYRYNSMNNQYVSPFFSSSFTDTSHSQSAMYASVFVHDNKSKLNVELGGRLNVHSRYGSNQTYTFNPSYSIDQHWRVFGSVATGFKAPTLYQLYAQSFGNPNLKPERTRVYEIGVQQTLRRISSRVVFFRRHVKEGIDYDYSTQSYFNYNRQTVQGIEVELRAEPVHNLTITANYTYIHSKAHNQSPITLKDTVYNYLLKRPKHNANLSIAYHYKALYVSATGKFVGKRFDSDYPYPDAVLDDYFILSAYAEYQPLKYLKVFVDAQNLTNKKFFDVRGYNSIPLLVNGGLTLSL